MRLASPFNTAWTGVVISEGGEILTTSEALPNAHVVDVRLWNGWEGQACVTGRDDDIGLALLEPLIESPDAYDYLELSGESPVVGQQLQLLQYPSSQPVIAPAATKVAGSKSLDNGYGYILVDADTNTTADGAVLLDESGRMVGMRMPPLWLLVNGIADQDEVVAVDAPAIASVALPVLRSGRMHVQPVVLQGSPGESPPLIPVIFHGEITIDGAPAPVGALLHAKLSKEGQPDLWQSTPIGTVGEYVMLVSANSRNYFGGTVEFWVDCKRSSTTAAYEAPLGRAVELDLTF